MHHVCAAPGLSRRGHARKASMHHVCAAPGLSRRGHVRKDVEADLSLSGTVEPAYARR
jgi:hypothetical protein